MEFNEILREIIKSNNYTQKQIAQKIGVKQSQISEWLKGKAKPGYDNIKAIIKNLDVTAEYILGFEDESGTKIQNINQTFNFKF